MRMVVLVVALLVTPAVAADRSATEETEREQPSTRSLEKSLRKELPLRVDAFGGTDPEALRPTMLKRKAYRGQDGVLVADLSMGSGPEAQEGDVVRVHYTIWLLDGGHAFDTSLGREPLETVLGQRVIEGWSLGVAGMQVGGRRQVLIPSQLAYGEAGAGDVVPPDASLVMELELVSLTEREPVPERPAPEAFASAVSLEGGVQVVDLVPGTGAVAMDQSPVTVEFTLWAPDGSVFFTTLERPRGSDFMVGAPSPDGPPLEGLNTVIRGMRSGGRRMARLPPETAFGASGMPGRIPPNATITAYVEVTDVRAPRRLPKRPFLRADDLRRTDSGLRFRIDRAGHGERAQPGQTVFVEYTMWRDDGTVVDSSYDRTHAFSFPLGSGRVIAGFDEAVADMNVGEQRVVVIPPELGYGDRDRGLIPAGSTLTVLIELVRVE